MSELDEKIREALADDRENENLFEEQNIIAEVISPFRGKNRWAILVATTFGVAAVSLAIWAGFKFASAELVRDQIMWAGVCMLGVLINSFIKVYYWMEMHSNRIMREIKRIELLLVQKRDEL